MSTLLSNGFALFCVERRLGVATALLALGRKGRGPLAGADQEKVEELKTARNELLQALKNVEVDAKVDVRRCKEACATFGWTPPDK